MTEQVTISKNMTDADFAQLVAMRIESINPADKAIVLQFLQGKRAAAEPIPGKDVFSRASAVTRQFPNADRLLWLPVDYNAPVRLVVEAA